MKTAGIEWVGGTVSMPVYITGEGESYRPDALFWMGADGAILGSTVAKPGELLPLAGQSLQSTIERPMDGKPHSPTRVRVSSAELADVLRAEHPGLEVVCAATPEMDAMLAMMREKMAEESAPEPSYLTPEIKPDAVGSFFKAAAALFRAKPWKQVPSDQCLFSVTIEQLGMRDTAMSVIGQMGQSFGFILFADLANFEAYLGAADAIEDGEEPEMPPHFALNFERGAELRPKQRKEIAEHHWEVAGARAYPSLVAVDEDLVPRPPTAKELTASEAIALTLTHMIAKEKALGEAWDGGEPVSHTFSATTHQGVIDVALRAPYRHSPIVFNPSLGLLASLTALEKDDNDEIAPDAREPLEAEFVRRFAASPEAESIDEINACRFVMDFAADYFGATIATLRSPELGEIVFGLIPRKVDFEPSDAPAVIDELHALYAFLAREFKLPQAASCLQVLSGDAIEKLTAALADSDNFGMAKTFFAAGRDAGFDVESPQGLEAWVQSSQGKPLPASRLPRSEPISRKAANAKKNKRKAARKARKRSR